MFSRLKRGREQQKDTIHGRTVQAVKIDSRGKVATDGDNVSNSFMLGVRNRDAATNSRGSQFFATHNCLNYSIGALRWQETQLPQLVHQELDGLEL